MGQDGKSVMKNYRPEILTAMLKGVNSVWNFPFDDRKFEQRFLGGRPIAISEKVPPEIIEKFLRFEETMNKLAQKKATISPEAGVMFEFMKKYGQRKIEIGPNVGVAESGVLSSVRRRANTWNGWSTNNIANEVISKDIKNGKVLDSLKTVKTSNSEIFLTAERYLNSDGLRNVASIEMAKGELFARTKGFNRAERKEFNEDDGYMLVEEMLEQSNEIAETILKNNVRNI
jgi:hypothetical protein